MQPECSISLYSVLEPVVGRKCFQACCLCLLAGYESGHTAFAGLCVTTSVCQCLEGVCASLWCFPVCIWGVLASTGGVRGKHCVWHYLVRGSGWLWPWVSSLGAQMRVWIGA